ncbi:MerR family transcriptional regulator [Streptomyces sp. RB6PN25]|uniref:MerR family transcriptional regulator n=1 Tax=Streptomyces humicola TaxID=2953240 RepID=A0ABT1Q6P4_9ACTN|nr:MerR family transcriptional regulator [Streptomyces humicola]MCQ4084457.1 MerR family transcriptional regulator [Streptomyces humicola]
MGLLTIGAFARAARLSPKALRLYDELGLLPPARVDPVTGYRFYHPAQLERARLVVWLRRIGMPLARIRVVCDIAPDAAAAEVSAFWAGVEADVSTRRDLAAFLIDHLSRKDAAVPYTTSPGPLGIRYAALSDTGLIRENNQDVAYADARLLAVADGFGAGGAAPASAAAIDALKHLDADADGVPAGDLLNVLDDAVRRANRAVQELGEPEAGTTLTAMLWSGSHLALVHVGDSRAYLLRDGELFQITHDHSLVQSMVDEGRITAEEAASHPQRALLLQALDGRSEFAPELRLHEALPGDRYLLCSDGLSAVVATGQVHDVLATVAEPEQAVRDLIACAHRAGGPDNVSCVVADILVPDDERTSGPTAAVRSGCSG